jgi:dihydropyrimidine dehydrogenase (NADP+)
MLPNVFTSKSFLPNVCENVKLSKSQQKIYELKGHVIVLGIGDTALDCARSALRVGAERVTVVFRRGFNDMRANDEIFTPSVWERINFISNLTPSKVIKENGVATGMEFEQYFFDGKEYKPTNEKLNIKADYIISAFGSKNSQPAIADLILNSKGKVDINRHTMQNNSKPHVFAGGDIIGTQNLVDAVNDGKVASWFLHKYIGQKHGIDYGDTPKLPGFFTEIDLVDISTEMAGVKFDNPYGLASAPPATSYPMIRRAFEMGWGFAVTKTFVLDKDEVVNVAPRIFKATNDPLRKEPSFSNIELIS